VFIEPTINSWPPAKKGDLDVIKLHFSQLSGLMSSIDDAPCKARNANVLILDASFGNAVSSWFFFLKKFSTQNKFAELSSIMLECKKL